MPYEPDKGDFQEVPADEVVKLEPGDFRWGVREDGSSANLVFRDYQGMFGLMSFDREQLEQFLALGEKTLRSMKLFGSRLG